jgi:hypothetical protein
LVADFMAEIVIDLLQPVDIEVAEGDERLGAISQPEQPLG